MLFSLGNYPLKFVSFKQNVSVFKYNLKYYFVVFLGAWSDFPSVQCTLRTTVLPRVWVGGEIRKYRPRAPGREVSSLVYTL